MPTQSTNDILADILTASQLSNKLNEAMVKKLEGMDKRLEKSGKDAEKAAKETNDKAIPGLKKATNLGWKTLKDTIKEGFKLQEKALSRGLTFTELTTKMGGVTNSLHSWGNSLTGYSSSIQTASEMYSAGFQNIHTNNKELATLAAATKLTGGNQKKILVSLAQNTAAMGMSNQEMSTLTNSTLSLSQKYGLTTEELIGAMEGLGEQLTEFAALGIGPKMMEASARVAAALGPQMAKMAPDLVQAMTKGSNMVQAGLLGITEERQKLLNEEGNAGKNALMAVIKGGEQSARIIEQFTQGGRETTFALDRAVAVYGKEILAYKGAYTKMKEAADKQGISVREYADQVSKQNEVNTKFRATWQNMVDQFLSPLQFVFTTVVQGLTGLFGIILEWIPWFPQLIGALFGVVTAIFAWIAAMKLNAARKAAGGVGGMIGKVLGGRGGGGGAAAAVAGGGGGGGGIGAAIGGVGKGIGELGKGIGAGIGGLVQKSLEGIAKGVAALGNPRVFLGALAMAAIGASLIPLAFSLKLMKGVGIGTILTLAAALLVFGAAAFGLGALLGTGLGAALFTVGVIGIAALGVALLPLAFAANLAAPGLLALGVALDKLAGVSIGSLLLLGPALVGVAGGLAVLGAGGLVTGLLSWLTPGEGPVEKLVKLGDAARPINKLVASLKALPGVLNATIAALTGLKTGDVDKFVKLAESARKVPTSMGSGRVTRAVNIGNFGESAERGPSGRVGKDPRKSWERGVRGATRSSVEAIKAGRDARLAAARRKLAASDSGAKMVVQRSRLRVQNGQITEQTGRYRDPAYIQKEIGEEQVRAKKYSGDPERRELAEGQIALLQKALVALQGIDEKLGSANDQRDIGNGQRQKQVYNTKLRPTDQIVNPGSSISSIR